MPSVDSPAEAKELVATQDENPLINLDELPFETLDGTDPQAHRGVPAGA
jgi:MHS family proline/betaine transporter-like MFS transporter